MFASSHGDQTPSQISHNGLYLLKQIQAIESSAKKTLPVGALMRAAGIEATKLAMRLLPQRHNKVLVLAGPGNNGGDALELAHLMVEEKYTVHVLLLGEESHYSLEAKQSLHRAQHSGVHWISQKEIESTPLQHWGLIVDGIFGIGLNRPIEAGLAQLINYINSNQAIQAIPLLALDIPSGLNVDTGTLVGEHGVALQASHTISFIANKIGLHTAKGKDYAGQIQIAQLGIDHAIFPPAHAHLLTSKTFIHSMPKRRHDSHKGSYGDVLIVGGNRGMLGAPLLAGRAALHSGAGRVHIGLVDDGFRFDPLQPELMCKGAQDSNFITAAVAIGPGLGLTDEAQSLVQRALQECPALVIDADALNLIATYEALQKLLRNRHTQNLRTIITPHPLEAARLLQCTTQIIQTDRCKAAKQLVDKFHACVVLKGAGTIVAESDYLWINSSGNPSLATAGTGDVLSGVCAALLAQDLSAAHAACLATYVHGKAADDCVLAGKGPIGLTASDIIPMIRSALNTLTKAQ